MVHVFWAARYGLELTDERRDEVTLRSVERILARIRALDPRPLTQARALGSKVVGNCRDHTVLLVTLLRASGVPARARCGFATYFVPDHFEDHWVCEYWDVARERWVLVDAQLDALQREVLELDFDPLDTPRDRFVVGGAAWQACRTGRADPDAFGIFDMKGLPFVLGDLVRDVLALAGVELLPWDGRSLMVALGDDVPERDLPLLDRLAALSVAVGDEDAATADAAWRELVAQVAAEPRLHEEVTA